MAAPHILIIGSGSVGRRHAKNLAAEGCTISAVDPRGDRLRQISKELTVVGCFETIEQGLHVEAKTLTGVVIGSPTAYHVPQCRAALQANLPILLEKPVAPDLAAAEALVGLVANSKAPLLLGYTWRWWPPLAQVRKLLAINAIGAVRHVRFTMAAHLADWHPWERYQDFFMAHAEQGGGALLDESHWIDLALWFFGMPESVSARVEKISDLEISSDDNVDMLLAYPRGLRVSLHLDLYARPHERTIRFSGEKGTILWTASPNRVAVAHGAEGKWAETDYTCERNYMFVAVGREFLAVARGEAKPSCTIEDGARVLRVIEAARKSHASGTVVRL
ncbi:MAG: Gfo/Idh/MocA family oxidoreductase [Alphaproteobacteria bacterium]|nr:Gfo/Idh/MocA family oxidoreductase [Alphaproteobacteria bacterium]